MTIVAARAGTRFTNLGFRTRPRSASPALDERRQVLTRSQSVQTFLCACGLNFGVMLLAFDIPLTTQLAFQKRGTDCLLLILENKGVSFPEIGRRLCRTVESVE